MLIMRVPRTKSQLQSRYPMNSRMKCLVLTAAFVGLLSIVRAVPMIRLIDGISIPIQIVDNGPGDAQAALGQVVFVGSIGNWSFNVQTGTTFPVIGTLPNPMLDLSFNATSNGPGGTLQIQFSMDGFGPTSANIVGAIGGTIAGGGSVTYQSYGGTNATLFSLVNPLTSQGPFSTMSYSNTMTDGMLNNVGPFALTQVVTLTHGPGTVQTTGDALLTTGSQVPDTGSSILLLGGTLISLGIVARFHRRR
jgi:hypothetical protein